MALKEQDVNLKVEKKPELYKTFLSGGIGGINLVLVGHPFDVIKVLMQTTSSPASAPKTSTFNVFSNLYKDAGIKGLYRGVLPPLYGVAPIMATSFWGYALGQDLVRNYWKQDKTEPLKFYELGMAGAFSALPSTLLVAPGERIKCLLQVDQKGTSLVQVVKNVYSYGGLRSIFQGTGITVLRDAPACMAYFTSYDILKTYFPNQGQFGLLNVILCGGLAGMINWLVCIPADVIKSRIQTSYTKLTIAQAYSEMKGNGKGIPIRKLYKGLTPALLRAFPANAACFLGVELTLKFLN